MKYFGISDANDPIPYTIHSCVVRVVMEQGHCPSKCAKRHNIRTVVLFFLFERRQEKNLKIIQIDRTNK